MKIILATKMAGQVEQAVRQLAPDCQIVHVDDDGNLDGDASDAEVYLRWWNTNQVLRKVLAAAPRLRWVHTPSAGVDHLLNMPELIDSEIMLTNSAGAHAIPIAEFVMMYMLSHIKKARTLIGLSREEGWNFEQRIQLDELAGKTVLVIGLGAIGQEIARRAAAFEMRVVGSRRTPAPMEGVAQVVGVDEWRSLLPDADYVVVATPLTDSTRGLVGAAEFAQMKRSAYLINIARGQILDTDALIEALHAGTIAGAALDVTEPEPPPADHPIWNAPNVWITPHISFSSPRTPQRLVEIFLDNLRRYINGWPLKNVVDKEAGY